MILSFHPCITANHQIILGSRSLESGDRSLIDKAHAIILSQSCSKDLYEKCSQSSAKLFPNYDARFKYAGKAGQSLMFNKTGSPHPDTIIWDSIPNLKESCRNLWPHKLPFLIKECWSHEGEGVFIVKDRETFDHAIEKLSILNARVQDRVISQELIQSDGNVLRVVLIGGKMLSYWKRPRISGQLITTVGSGAIIDKTWRKDLQKEGCLRAKKLSESKNINLAAFDLVFSIKERKPRPFFLEVNYFFGRRGLGGSIKYYKLLFQEICTWLSAEGFDPGSISLI